METLVAALTQAGRISGIALSSPLYAAVSALHVLGIALLVGAIVLVDLRLAGLVKRLDLHAMVLMRSVARLGAALAITTGILLASARPGEYLANRVFLAKMAVVGVGLVNALIFEVMARRRPLAALVDTPYARAAAILSLALWPVVIGLGRWIAFV